MPTLQLLVSNLTQFIFQLVDEVKLLTNKNINDKLTKYLTVNRVDTIIKIIQMKKTKVAKELIATIGQLTNVDMEGEV